MILNVRPLAFEQLLVGRPQIARRNGNRFIFVLLKKADSAHVGTDETENGIAIGRCISFRREDRGERKLDAKIGQIDQFVETRAAANKRCATDGCGIDGPGAQRRQPISRPADREHGNPARIDPELFECKPCCDLIRASDRADADLLARKIRSRLEKAVAPVANLAHAAVLREFEEDRASLAAFDPLLAKYKAGRHPLVAALDVGIAHLRSALETPISVAYHHDWRIALSQALFSPTAAITLDDPAAAPPPPARVEDSGALRTAAELVAGRT